MIYDERWECRQQRTELTNRKNLWEKLEPFLACSLTKEILEEWQAEKEDRGSLSKSSKVCRISGLLIFFF
jgi:hypothetical protein